MAAAAKYDIPANVMLAVAFQEAGKPGQAVLNANGTYDYGSMQINTAWLRELKKYGITAHDVSRSGCYSYDLAAWRIRHHIKHDPIGDVWQKVSNYHSYTPEYNAQYRQTIIKRATYWANWLEKRFVTIEVQNDHTAAKITPTIPTYSPHSGVKKSLSANMEDRKRFKMLSANYIPRKITALN